jgi:hypothetical protein
VLYQFVAAFQRTYKASEFPQEGSACAPLVKVFALSVDRHLHRTGMGSNFPLEQERPDTVSALLVIECNCLLFWVIPERCLRQLADFYDAVVEFPETGQSQL